MIKKWLVFFLVLAGLLAVFPGCSPEQSPPKHHVVGILSIAPKHNEIIAGFKKGMAAYGYLEGKNVSYVFQGPLKSKEKLDDALAYLLSQNIDLLFSLSTPATKKAKKALLGSGIPIVFTPVLFPQKSGIVDSLARPGGNITGVRVGGSAAKGLGWLQAIAPAVKDLFVPTLKGDITGNQVFADLRRAAPELGIKVHGVILSSPDELAGVMAALPANIDAIWMVNSSLFSPYLEQFVQAAIRHKLPLVAATSLQRVGVLLTYGKDTFRVGEQASRLAHKILQGVDPAELPVEIAQFFLGIDLQAAQAIGLEIPEDILNQADFIVR